LDNKSFLQKKELSEQHEPSYCNGTGALNEKGEFPDCSGSYELTTNIYEDISQAGNEIYSLKFEYVDGVGPALRIMEASLLSRAVILGVTGENRGALNIRGGLAFWEKAVAILLDHYTTGKIGTGLGPSDLLRLSSRDRA
jgi:hypothetical protein